MSEKGEKTPESFVYFKFEQRISGTKDPQSAADALIQRLLKATGIEPMPVLMYRGPAGAFFPLRVYTFGKSPSAP